MIPFNILVIDDEADIKDLISDLLKENGYEARTASNSTEVFSLINKQVPDAIILDIWLEGSELDGLGILEIIKARYPLLPVIVISGHANIETAVNSIKLGAYDFIEKPFTQKKLIITLKRACESAMLQNENLELKSRVILNSELVGSSILTNKLKTEISKAAAMPDARVILYGDKGSGKTLSADIIHRESKRKHKPFVIFNPVGMSFNEIKASLFDEKYDHCNHLLKKTPTVIEAANGGTLYINEITALPLHIQDKLLQFLEESNKDKNLDVRLIVSTQYDLLESVQSGKFCGKLYNRLNVKSIKVPSLAERKEDIQLLIEHFVSQITKVTKTRIKKFTPEAIAALQNHKWIGNIKELKNIIEWVLLMSSSNQEYVTQDMLPSEINNNITIKVDNDTGFNVMYMPLKEAREEFEKKYLSIQMDRFNRNISKTSAFIGMERSALHRKLKNLNIHSAKEM